MLAGQEDYRYRDRSSSDPGSIFPQLKRTLVLGLPEANHRAGSLLEMLHQLFWKLVMSHTGDW